MYLSETIKAYSISKFWHTLKVSAGYYVNYTQDEFVINKTVLTYGAVHRWRYK